MGYTIHGLLHARILVWVAIPFSRGSPQSRDQTQVSHIAWGFFTSWAIKEARCYRCARNDRGQRVGCTLDVLPGMFSLGLVWGQVRLRTGNRGCVSQGILGWDSERGREERIRRDPQEQIGEWSRYSSLPMALPGMRGSPGRPTCCLVFLPSKTWVLIF